MDARADLFRVRRTVFQMLVDRRYLVPKSDVEMDRAAFLSMFAVGDKRDKLMIQVQHIDDPANQIIVFFPDEEKTGISTLRACLDHMRTAKVRNAIIILQRPLTGVARKGLSIDANCRLETFEQSELLVNITHHELVPKHVLLSEQEKLDLLHQYKLRETQLPRIQLNDPVARYYGLQRGQVVKILRSSETAGRYITYRLVV